MGWNEVKKILAQIDFLKLENDGDTIVGTFVDEPVIRESVFQGQRRVQIAFPFLTADGLKIWTTGKTTARTLRKFWDSAYRKPVKITRQGAAGSPDTVYNVETDSGSAALKKALDELDPEVLAGVMNRVTNQDNDEIPI